MKYYKLLKSTLYHNGYRFHEGLNIDPKPWDKKLGQPGGFSFTTAEHLFRFGNQYSFICEVELPENTKVAHFEKCSKADRIIIKNIRYLYSVNVIDDLLQNGVPLEEFQSFLVERVCQTGDLDVIQLLVNKYHMDVHSYSELLFRNACKYGHLEIAKKLLEDGVDVHIFDDYALVESAIKGHDEMVRFLLDHGANVHARNDAALCYASNFGHENVVKTLLEYDANVSACCEHPLRIAVKNGHVKIIKMLLDAGADKRMIDDSDYGDLPIYEYHQIRKLLSA